MCFEDREPIALGKLNVLHLADISHMNLLAPVASKFSSIIEMIVAILKIDFPFRTLFEVDRGPKTAIGGDLPRCSREFGHTSPSGFETFPFL